MLTKQGFFPPNTKSAGSFPYTPAVVVGDQVFISGQGPIDPATGHDTLAK
jgi:enamine deaminase RidA (YjgF/YER057c/UK114 family)